MHSFVLKIAKSVTVYDPLTLTTSSSAASFATTRMGSMGRTTCDNVNKCAICSMAEDAGVAGNVKKATSMAPMGMSKRRTMFCIRLAKDWGAFACASSRNGTADTYQDFFFCSSLQFMKE
eukprot:scaffold1143_cov177-Amphora_coffeaeformis.AAC.24